MPSTPTVERAYELARSGQFANCSEIAFRLKQEGYVEVRSHFDGQVMKRQLLKLCQAASPLAQAEAPQTSQPGSAARPTVLNSASSAS